MDKKEAIAEISRMKDFDNTSAYFANVNTAPSAKPAGDLPVTLSESHAELEQARALLSEQSVKNAKIAVAVSVDHDKLAVKKLLEDGKLTVPVANKIVALCEAKRADQMVRLAEGDPTGAADADADVNAILGALGELPQSVAVEATPAAAGVGAEVAADPAAAAPNPDDQLDAMARKIMQEQPGIAYADALLMAEQMLKEGI